MIKKVPVEEAIGQALLHDITGIFPGGSKGVMFKRGHIIKDADIEKLKDIGKNNIYVGELEDGQVHEEDAALELARLVCGENTYYTDPKEGKVSIRAKEAGLLKINTTALNAINNLGDYTLATKYSNTRADKDQNIGGLRIVPLWTSEEIVERAKAICKESGPIFEVKKFQKLRIGNIITGSEVYYGRIEDAFEGVLRKKYEKYDCQILGFTKCPDEPTYIVDALDKYLEEGADLVVFTGGMSVDPDDLTPKIIKDNSDELIIQGLPIQPGNMLTLARKDQAYLLGVPGASIHSEITSLDMVLPRLFAREDLKRQDFTILGEGGLY